MPHRSGYFVLAYQWDHHCRSLLEGYQQAHDKIQSKAEELRKLYVSGKEKLFQFYQKWYQIKQEYKQQLESIQRRQSTIESFLNSGYGVNVDLARALTEIQRKYLFLSEQLDKAFQLHVQEVLSLGNFRRNSLREQDILEILKSLSKNKDFFFPNKKANPAHLFLHFYWQEIQHTRSEVSRYIQKKLLLQTGYAIQTMMTGSVGHDNPLPSSYTKRLAHRNFHEAVAFISQYQEGVLEVNLSFLLELHRILTRDMIKDAGQFRSYDFPDKNGATVVNDNLSIELHSLESELAHLNQVFHTEEISEYLQQLSLIYYQLLSIHPFGDGNGRVAKFFLNLMLIRRGLPPATFDPGAEIFALPRYGGDVEEMYKYLCWRIREAVDFFLWEKSLLQRVHLYNNNFINPQFHSGIHFGQTSNPKKFFLSLDSYVIDQPHEILAFGENFIFRDMDEMRQLEIHYGFSYTPTGDWHDTQIRKAEISLLPKEKEFLNSKVVQVFMMDHLFFYHQKYNFIQFVLHSPTTTFNNRGQNYIFELI